MGTVTATQGSVLTGNVAGDTTIGVDLGTLNAGGGSATVTYEVTLNDPFPEGVTTVINQGLVSGSNFPNVPTDDPSTAPMDDPTVVSIVVRAVAEIPTLSQWAMLLFALLLAGAAVRFLVR